MIYEPIQSNLCNPQCTPDCTAGECTSTHYQHASVSMPVEIKPTVGMGDIKVECIGDAVVVCRENPVKKTCELTIAQNICVKIPIVYRADVCVGNAAIECNCDIPCNCK